MNLLKKTYRNVKLFSKDWFADLWKGERPLWEAWLVLGAVIVSIVKIIFPLIAGLFHGLGISLYFFTILLQWYWWIVIWRCSENSDRIFFFLSRFLVSVG
ncbi:MAG: hypothetical protein WAW45_02515, partial [Atribacterota bacterium]